MKTVFALLVLCEGNPSITGGFLSQRPSDAELWFSFDVSLNNMLNKHLTFRLFETLYFHYNEQLVPCPIRVNNPWDALYYKDPFRPCS